MQPIGRGVSPSPGALQGTWKFPCITCFADRDFAEADSGFACLVIEIRSFVVMSEHVPFLRSRYGAAAVASAALAAAAAAWYTARSPTDEVSPADNGTASPSGLLAPVRFKV